MQLQRLAVSLSAIIAFGGAAALYSSHPARSSDHQDSPAVVARPGADITDVFMFPAPQDRDDVELVMDVVPLIPAGTSANYSLDPSVLYQFKLAHGPLGTRAPADLAVQILPKGRGARQELRAFVKTGYTPGTSATTGTPIGEYPFNKPGGSRLGNDIVAFTGPRADPFFFDLFQFFKVLPDRLYSNPRTGDTLGSATPTFNGYPQGAKSGLASRNYACSTAAPTNALTQINGGFDVISIVVEVPRRLLVARGQSPLVHLWATASVRSRNREDALSNDRGDGRDDPARVYDQTELLSRPAVKELFETFADHAKTNVSEPYNDPTIADSIAYFMKNVAGRSAAISNVVTSVLYPNEIAADLSQPGPAAYLGVETGGATGGKFGGRALTDDVIDTSLGVVFGNTIPALKLAADDGKENTCLTNEHVASGQGGVQTQATYPYLAQPH